MRTMLRWAALVVAEAISFGCEGVDLIPGSADPSDRRVRAGRPTTPWRCRSSRISRRCSVSRSSSRTSRVAAAISPWNYVASAPPDGYTLLMCENALAISQGLFKQASSTFNPVTQYDPIAHVASSPLALVVANLGAGPFGSGADRAAHAIAPKKMNWCAWPASAASPIWCSRCFAMAPASTRCMTCTRAAQATRRDVIGTRSPRCTWRRSRSPTCTRPARHWRSPGPIVAGGAA